MANLGKTDRSWSNKFKVFLLVLAPVVSLVILFWILYAYFTVTYDILPTDPRYSNDITLLTIHSAMMLFYFLFPLVVIGELATVYALKETIFPTKK